MALLTPSVIDITTGDAPTFVAASAGGDEARTDSRVFAVYKNGSAGAITVTAVVPGNLETGDAKTDKAYSIAAGAEAWIPLDDVYRNSSGKVAFTYSGVTSLTVAIVRR